MAKITAILGAIIISITNFLGISKQQILSPPNEVTSNMEIPSGTPTEISMSPTPTVSISRNSPTLTPTPTISLELIEQCKNVSKPEKYFSGFGCYYDEYTEAMKNQDKNSVRLSIDEVINSVNITAKAKAGLGDLFYSVCLKITPKIYKTCTDSLERNIGRFSTQIYSVYSSELNVCYSKVATGDNKMKEKIKDSYWRWKMRNNIERLYLHCAKTDGTLDTYSF